MRGVALQAALDPPVDTTAGRSHSDNREERSKRCDCCPKGEDLVFSNSLNDGFYNISGIVDS